VLAIVAGLAGAWAVRCYIRFMPHGVSELDPATFAFTPILLAMIVLIASFGPALRAVRVDPMTVLREE
jgi:putative ABC transport system permease protein